jgi:hypothetical protein
MKNAISFDPFFACDSNGAISETETTHLCTKLVGPSRNPARKKEKSFAGFLPKGVVSDFTITRKE